IKPANSFTEVHSNLHPVRRQDSTVDPFDSYSILKPDDGAFSLPAKTRAPAIFAVATAVGLILLAVALPGRVVNSFGRMLDSAGGNSTIPVTDSAVIRQNKPDPATLKSPQNKNSSLSSDRQFLRKEASRAAVLRNQTGERKTAAVFNLTRITVSGTGVPPMNHAQAARVRIGLWQRPVKFPASLVVPSQFLISQDRPNHLDRNPVLVQQRVVELAIRHLFRINQITV